MWRCPGGIRYFLVSYKTILSIADDDYFQELPVKVDLDEDIIANEADPDEDDNKVGNNKKKNYACAFYSFHTLRQGEMNNHLKVISLPLKIKYLTFSTL